MIGQYPEIDVVFLTNPTIDGFCFDVSKVKQAIGDERLLIIDESYGTQFYFDQGQGLPSGALLKGADVCINRIDTDLGGLVGTAILNVSKQSSIDTNSLKSLY